MQTFEAIESRRSIKHFDPKHEFSEQEIKKLMGATLLSPTSFNIQNWRFVVVRNKEKRQQIFEASYYQAQVKDASSLSSFMRRSQSTRKTAREILAQCTPRGTK